MKIDEGKKSANFYIKTQDTTKLTVNTVIMVILLLKTDKTWK